MFDISWSELLILAAVTLIFVGPKDLPVFLRTLGKYAGVVKRHAAEFRAHFDAAMREAELEALKKDVEELRRQVSNTTQEAVNALPSGPAFPGADSTRTTARTPAPIPSEAEPATAPAPLAAKSEP